MLNAHHRFDRATILSCPLLSEIVAVTRYVCTRYQQTQRDERNFSYDADIRKLQVF